MSDLEQTVLFEEKAYLAPKDMNNIVKDPIDKILLKHLRGKIENKCSQHGFVVPKSLQILSRSAGQLENGRFTGNIVFHCQLQARVYNPVNGTRIIGTILKRNKMGLYVIYKDAIRVLIPRDLHLGNEDFETLQVGESIEIEIRKSRFQIQDPFILSVGMYIRRIGAERKYNEIVEEQLEEEAPVQPTTNEPELSNANQSNAGGENSEDEEEETNNEDITLLNDLEVEA
jgi:DNA-directed RNA polymerase subunit E'/Rpb7